jgi:hypothetical protein
MIWNWLRVTIFATWCGTCKDMTDNDSNGNCVGCGGPG